MSAALILAAFGLPLAMAAALAAPALQGAVLRLLPMAALPALAAAGLLSVPVTVAEPWLLMGAGFGLDATGRVFLGFTALLWAAAGWAAAGWLRTTAHPLRFAVCFLLAMTGNLGLILATDAPGFYAFFALMSFASYGLVIHEGSAKALAAGRLYIAFVVAGELALFAGLALAVAGAGSLALADIRAAGVSDVAAALLILGFGAKLGVMPLHLWLPPAHGAAPAPASAVLSGAMIKAGLFGLMAVLPLGTAALPDHGTVLLAAGLVTVFGAALLGVREANPKAVLGFSSVGQMGLMALGLGAALKAPGAWAGVAPVLVLLAAHHALAKGALFLGAGAALARPAPGLRLTILGALALPALALAGVPGSGGGWGKEALKAALAAGPAGWAPWLVLGITLGTFATTLLMVRFAVMLWEATADQARLAGAAPASRPAGLGGFALLIAAALALAPLWPRLAPELAAALPAAGAPSIWPVLAGIASALAGGVAAHAVAVGPARMWAQMIAPLLRLRAEAQAEALRARRALRRIARRLPARLEAQTEALRLAPAAPVALMALVLVIAAAGAEPPAIAADPQDPATGLSQALTPPPGAETAPAGPTGFDID
jgi:formate hydrogenlyase subunit 3/multisubunit Na+/H+ antiporter MnhD subunit